MGIIATDHGMDNMKARLKTSKKHADVQALEAWTRGLPREAIGGTLRRFVDKKYFNSDRSKEIRIWRNFIWIFGRDGALVTCWAMPGGFAGDVRLQTEKWERRKADITQKEFKERK